MTAVNIFHYHCDIICNTSTGQKIIIIIYLFINYLLCNFDVILFTGHQEAVSFLLEQCHVPVDPKDR